MTRKRTNNNGRSWPIYLIAAGTVTILLRFLNDDESATILRAQLIFGAALIVYGIHVLVWRSRICGHAKGR